MFFQGFLSKPKFRKYRLRLAPNDHIAQPPKLSKVNGMKRGVARKEEWWRTANSYEAYEANYDHES